MISVCRSISFRHGATSFGSPGTNLSGDEESHASASYGRSRSSAPSTPITTPSPTVSIQRPSRRSSHCAIDSVTPDWRASAETSSRRISNTLSGFRYNEGSDPNYGDLQSFSGHGRQYTTSSVGGTRTIKSEGDSKIDVRTLPICEVAG